ncbi:hypothetical protein Nepgr_003609 [Nepenthes gracilis]|uniref:Plastid division regulator MinE n=1 Tax=Nepenthes gracilis TaxID=150966 RepID=A0AAD3XE25_NEPGR|nr:hypothetical protein Nepgr_003609 [Nepenthes gracilis]
MAISGDLRVFATLAPHRIHPFRNSMVHSSKVDQSGFLNGGVGISEIMPKKPQSALNGLNVRCQSNLTFGVAGDDKMPTRTITQDAESLLLNAINMSFFERLNLAWKIIFPSPTTKRNSNANIAKQRLRMILFSDRCVVSDEAKRKIVKNIVTALSDFVEIESKEKVQLSVSTGTDLGTVYSVTVPVRRVKPEYQDEDEIASITNIEYKDTGDTSGSVDVRLSH